MGFFSRTFALGKILPFALIAVLLVGVGAYFFGRSDGKTAIKLANERTISAAYKKGAAAGEKAAETRLADERRQLEAERKYEDIISKAPGGRNSPASVALGCERLRRAGFGGADLPAECRSQGSDGK